LGFVLYRQGKPEAEGELLEALQIFKPLVAEFPGNPEFQRQLGNAYLHLGNLYRDTQRPEKAVSVLLETLKVYEPLAERFPTVPNYPSELGGALNNLAMVRLNQGDLPEAQQLLARAIVHQRAALKVNPRNPVYREFLSNHIAVLADVQARRGLHTAAVESALELANHRKENAEDAYDAACVIARCVPLAEQDPTIADDKRRELAQLYGEQAITLLRDAMTRGYKDVEHLKQDDDLASVRKRTDFQKLLTEMETMSPK
jgi:tetratricopeptide (TPR) repeat protein